MRFDECKPGHDYVGVGPGAVRFAFRQAASGTAVARDAKGNGCFADMLTNIQPAALLSEGEVTSLPDHEVADLVRDQVAAASRPEGVVIAEPMEVGATVVARLSIIHGTPEDVPLLFTRLGWCEGSPWESRDFVAAWNALVNPRPATRRERETGKVDHHA